MKKNILLSMGAILVSVLLILPFRPLLQKKSASTQLSQAFLPTTTAEALANSAVLNDSETYKDLPVGKVETFNTPNAWGTAIYMPQTHRNPGSEAADSSNDSAQIAQEQMYKIISFLDDKYHINNVMAEGDLYGQVPQNKIDFLAKKITARNNLANQVGNLEAEMQKENVDPNTQQQFAINAKTYIASLDREIILQGAPYKLKAEGKQMSLYGSENKATQDESTIIVRNYIYQQDRQQQLASASTPDRELAQNSNVPSLSNVYALLMSLRGDSNDSLKSDLDNLQAVAGDNDLSASIASTKAAYQGIENLKTENVVPAASVPSRQDNPYSNIQDPNQIDSLIKQSESKIQSVVIDKRNKETAINFADMLKNNHADIGIIQFGAGHEDGLVKELNSQGLNVIVVTASEVLTPSVGNQATETSQAASDGTINNATLPNNLESILKLLKR